MSSHEKRTFARSVAGVVLREGRVFLARRVPGGSIGGKWEFPGGKIEPGEAPSEALAREFDEELGVQIEVGGMIGECLFADGMRRFTLTAYEVTLAGEPHPRGEHTALEWFPVERLSGLDLPDSDRGLVPSVIAYVERNGKV